MNPFSVCIALLLTFITPCINAQDSPVFNLETVSTINSTATVAITATGFSNIVSGNLKVTYDPVVAVPVAVTKGPGLAGTFSCNLADTGIIRIGWFTYPPITLPDSSVIFNIQFTKASSGTSILNFDDGTVSPVDCQFTNGSHDKLNDEPFSTYYLPGSLSFNEPAGPVTKAPALTASPNEKITVPITVRAFNNVGAVSLTLEYDPAVLNFNSAENTGGFPGLNMSNPVPGCITVSGTLNMPEGYSMPDESVFFTLNFHYQDGSTTLSWNDEDGSSCEYSGPRSAYIFPDTPQPEYYISGKVEQSLAPQAPDVRLTQPTCTVSTGEIAVTSPLGAEYTYSIDGTNYQSAPAFSELFTGTYNVTVMNEEGHVSPVTTAVIKKQPYTPVAPAVEITAPSCEAAGSAILTNYHPDYAYSFSPEGPLIGAGGEITSFITGQSYIVTATSSDGCESASSEPFTAEDRLEAPEPVITSEHTIDGRVTLTVGEGNSYLWSTGETTRSIVATTTGEYTVEVTYENGCSRVSSPISIVISSSPHTEANKGVKIKAYPNPFSERLRIEFCIPEPGLAQLEIIDMNGRQIKCLLDCNIEAGIVYTAEFVPESLTSNVYYYKLTISNRMYSGKMVYNAGR